MRRLLDLRITHWGWKLAYVVAVLVVGPTPAQLGTALGSYEIGFVIGTVVRTGLILLAARIFRGHDEAVAPPRPWWQMTARPKLSRRLGILFAVLFALNLIGVVLGVVGVIEPTPPAVAIASLLETGLFAYLYLGSAAKLRRLGIESTEPASAAKRLTVG